MKAIRRTDASLAHRTIGDVHWHVRPDWESALLDDNGLHVDEWLSLGCARKVKSHQRRAVYVVEHAGRTFFVKHDRNVGLARAIGYFFRGGAARREWRAIAEALGRGVRTAVPVAWGERIRWGLAWESFLITEAIPNAVPLDRFVFDRVAQLPVERQADVRRQVFGSLAELVAAIHTAGICHGDFHAGNMLVRVESIDAQAPPEIYLIDLQGARFSGPLDWPTSRRNLIVLNAKWFDRASLAERWRFLRTYLALRSELDAPPRNAILEQLELGAREHARHFHRRRDRRAMETNQDFTRTRGRQATLHAVHDLPEGVSQALLRQPDRLLWRHLDRPVKLDHASLMVRAELPLANGPVEVAYKRWRPRSWRKALWSRFRGSRALRGWYLGQALRARGIATARPLVVREPRRGGFRRESYLATEWIDGAENLHLWGWQLAERPAAQRLRLAARCAESLGRLVGRMHSRHVSHGDLKGSNLLIAERDDELRTWLIDVDGVRIHRRLSPRRREADLARLATSLEAHPWVSSAIRYRFLRAYAAESPPATIRCKSLWRGVARRAARLIAKKRRQGKAVL